jgi:GT2 family glycosyltransferase
MATVTGVVANWNRRDLLMRLLESLQRQSHPIERVVVVDNGSDDDSAEMAESFGALVIRMGHNHGFARATNRGIQEAKTDWVMIVNNDVELEAHWLERVLAVGERTGAWFGIGKIYQTRSPETLDGTFDVISRGGCAWRCGQGRPDSAAWVERGSCWFAPLTAALFRRETFERVGPLDERFESYLEDVDLGLRCAVAGLTGCYVPEAVAFHWGSATLGKWHPSTVRRIARNQVFLLAKHYPRGWWRRLGWPVLVGHLLWGLMAARHGAALAYLRGKIEGAMRFGELRRGTAPSDLVAGILSESERQLRHWQQLAGYDTYWRLYFALT